MKVNYARLTAVVMVFSFLILGCAGKTINQPIPKDPEELYTKGIVLYNKEKYKEAIKVFNQLKSYFPSDELYASKADLRIADCTFSRKEYPEAISRYAEFKKQRPFHPDIPYAEFQIGLCYYRQILSKDRDQEATIKALTAFQNVVSNFPDSIFAQKAQEKIAFCQRRLAENELYIARFYLRKRQYPAVEKRAALVFERYPESGTGDEALYYLAVALHRQERDSEALSPLKRLVEGYPQSSFAKEGQRLLASLKTEGVIEAAPAREGGEVTVTTYPGTTKKEEFPFQISARRTEKIPERNVIMYTGDVVVLGEEVTIRSDSLQVTMGEGDVPREMAAMGEVKVNGGGEEIFCKKAVWSPTKQLLVMTGDAKIRGLAEWIRGDEITLDLDTGRIEIKGKKVEPMD